MAELVSVAEWAKGLGMSRQAGHQAVQRCNIPLFDGKVDPGVATVLYQQRTRARVKPGAAGSTPPAAAQSGPDGAQAPTAPEGGGYDDHKRRQAKAEAERAEIEVARLSGRVLDRERAERGGFEAGRELRDAVFAALRSAARRVVGLTDLREVELALEDEGRQAFSGWEERMRKRLEEAAKA